MKQNRGIWQEVSRLYEQRLAEAVGEVLNSERFVRAVQVVLTTSEEFRKLVIRAIESAMSNLELPTGQDFARLHRMMDGLDDALFDIRSELHEVRKNGLNRIEGRLDDLDTRLRRIEQRLTAPGTAAPVAQKSAAATKTGGRRGRPRGSSGGGKGKAPKKS